MKSFSGKEEGPESQATMSDLLRDTVFGQLIRLLFGNRIHKFPDEVDPNLWKQCLREEGVEASSISGHINDLKSFTGSRVEARNAAKREQQGNSVDPAFGNGPISLERGIEGNEKPDSVLLVDWYGSDDKEVCGQCLLSSH